MSWQALGWATKCRVGDDGEKLLLIMLANYANEDGESWYSQERLSFDTEIPVRTLRRRLQALEEKGFIQITPRRQIDGTKTTSLIRLISLPAKSAPNDATGQITIGQNGATTGQNGHSASGQQVAEQEPSGNHQKESSLAVGKVSKKKIGQYTPEFESDIWQPYPRKARTSKINAFKKFDALSPEQKEQVKATIPHFAMATRASKTEEQFIPHLEFYISRGIFETVIVMPGNSASGAEPGQFDAQTWENLSKIYKNTNNWSRQWGPEPGEKGCKMPVTLQARFVNHGLTSH